MLLKPNMIIKGKQNKDKTSFEEVAKMTLMVLRNTIPPAVPGIFFLSGGQTEEEATRNLNAINASEMKKPWSVSFSFGRALQHSCITNWAGKDENLKTAQAILLKRAKANGEAQLGKYVPDENDKSGKDELYQKDYVY